MPDQGLSIGGSSAHDVWLPDCRDEEVARFGWRSGRLFLLEGVGWIEGKKRRAPCPAAPGMWLRVGAVTVVVEEVVEVEAALTMPPPMAAAPHASLPALSDREREVLIAIARGESGAAIAARLGISQKTLETYRSRLGKKLGLVKRSDLVRAAIDLGLLQRSDDAPGPSEPIVRP